MAARLNLEPERMKATLKATVFKDCRNDEELAALVVVANEYNLNPLLKEIQAFPAKGGGIVPMIPIDGWVKMVNRQAQMDGMEFEDHHDDKGNLVSMTCRIYRKDRSRPIVVTEYLNECRRNTDPWRMEHRMLRHKALMQCARYAFGFSGVYDEDEASDIARNGGMRDASGRVVEDPPPALEQALVPDPTSTPRRSRATKPAAGAEPTKEPQAAEMPPAEDPHAEAAETEVLPPRIEMVDGVKAVMQRAELSIGQAEAKFRQAGLLDEKTLSRTTDAELFRIYQAAEQVLMPNTEPEGNA